MGVRSPGFNQPPAVGGGHGIREDGGAVLTTRPDLDFVGFGVTATDDSVNGRTRITIPDFAPDPAATGTGPLMAVPMMSGFISNQGVLNRMYSIPFVNAYAGRYISSFQVLCTTGNASAVARIGVHGLNNGFNIPLVANLGTFDLSVATLVSGGWASGSRTAIPVGTGHISICIQGGAAKLAFGTIASAKQEVSALFLPPVCAFYDDGVTGAFTHNYGPYNYTSVTDAPWFSMRIVDTP